MIDDYNDADFAMTSQVGFGLGATLPEGSVGSFGISSCVATLKEGSLYALNPK